MKQIANKGIVTIPIVVGLAFVVLTLGLGVATFSINEGEASKVATSSNQALLYARAGINDALRRIALDKNFEPASTTACYADARRCYLIDFVANGCSENLGCARVTASGTASPRTVTSEGRIGGHIRKATTTVTVGANGELGDVAWEEYIPSNPPYYWVGGTGNWSDTAHWSLSSNGPPGEGPPGINNDVIFNDDSFTGTNQVVTANAAVKARSITFCSPTCTTKTPKISTSGGSIELSGSLTLAPGMTSSGTPTITFSGSRANNIAMNGATLAGAAVTFNGGGSWTFQDAFNIGSGTLRLIKGNLDTNAKAVTVGKLLTEGVEIRSLTITNSQITVSGVGSDATVWDLSSNVDLSDEPVLDFNYSGSTITLEGNTTSSGSGIVFKGADSGDGSVYNNVIFSNPKTTKVLGNNTFGTLQRIMTTAPTFQPYYENSLRLGGNQTVTGQFTVTSAASVANSGDQQYWRMLVASDTFGTQRTLNVGSVNLSHVDFQDINATGSWAGTLTEVGDALGNSPSAGGMFAYARVPKTKYWRCTGSCIYNTAGEWLDDGAWADSAVGLAGAGAPLPQDNVVVDQNSAPTIRVQIGRLAKDISFSSDLLVNPTLSLSSLYGSAAIYGSFTAGPISYSDSSNGLGLSFETRSSASITSGGNAIGMPITINSPGGEVTLADKLNTTTLNLDRGTLTGSSLVGIGEIALVTNLVLDNPACPASTYCTRALNMGTGQWTVGGGWFANPATNLTFNAQTSTLKMAGTATTLEGGGLTYNNLTVGGVSATATGTTPLTMSGDNTIDGTFTVAAATGTKGQTTNITGSNTINNLTIEPPTSSATQTVQFKAGDTGLTTVNGTFLSDTGPLSATKTKLISATAGSQWKLNASQLEIIRSLDVKDSDASLSNPNKMDNLCNGATGNCLSSGNNKCWVFQTPHPTDVACGY